MENLLKVSGHFYTNYVTRTHQILLNSRVQKIIVEVDKQNHQCTKSDEWQQEEDSNSPYHQTTAKCRERKLRTPVDAINNRI